MSNLPSDRPHFFLRQPIRTSVEDGAGAAAVAIVLHEEERAFEFARPAF